MTTPAPTPEQQAIIDTFKTGEPMVIVACAGSGKTTSLRMIANSTPKRGVYVAYNRAIADDAAKTFPGNVLCQTAHKFAWNALGRKYKTRLDGERVPAAKAATILGIRYALTLDDRTLQPAQLARLATETVTRFCYSDDGKPERWHVPAVTGLEEPAQRSAVQDAVYPLALKAWADLNGTEGKLRFTPDMFLKIWAMGGPVLSGDYILYDEAQDANPVVLGLLKRQGAPVIPVGDPYQAIYGWRGAVDAMDEFGAQHRLTLSKSFRFGPAIADEANVWLDILGAELRVTGFEKISSVVGDVTAPRSILCRTNGGAMGQVMAAMEARRRVALVGGGADIKWMAEAAIELKAGNGTSHPELCAFRTWSEVQEYVEEGEGSDLKVFVQLIDRYGPELIIGTINRLTRKEEYADVVISTAHKAKGREWPTVLVNGDFKEPELTEDGEQGEVARPDAMLHYVSVTRAQQALDLGGLSWGRKYLPVAAV